MQELMARKRSTKGTEKDLNLHCEQTRREQDAKGDGTEDRVPVGAHRRTSTAAKVKEERIVLEMNSGPRPEARKGDKGKRKVATVRPEFAGAVGNPDTSRRIASRVVGA